MSPHTKTPWPLAFLPILVLACTLGGLLVPTPIPILPQPTDTPVPTASPVEAYAVPDEGAQHIADGETGTYAHYPPSSGEHYARPLEWNIYIDPVPPEYYVHNLEHGGIVILYQCAETCPEIEEQFLDWWRTVPPDTTFQEVKIIVSPNANIEHAVVALAWGWELDLAEFDEEKLLEFYLHFVNQGPELVP